MRWALVGILVLTTAAELSAAEPRVLRFPAERSLGIVYARPAFEGPYRHALHDSQWQPLGEARGDVRVPDGAVVRLDVSTAGSANLDGLDTLQPDDLLALSIAEGLDGGQGLGHVGRLAGLRILSLRTERLGDAGLEHLAGLKQLRDITLDSSGRKSSNPAIGDGAMKVLAQLPELEGISLRQAAVTDAGLAELVALKSLKWLELTDTQVSDAGLVHLSAWPHLEALSLRTYARNKRSTITDEGLKPIGKATELQELNLGGTSITDAGLKHLQGLSRLKRLELDDTDIPEEGLALLEPLTALENLRLYMRYPTTDVGAAHLAKLKSLRHLTEYLEVTGKGIALLATLPHLETLDLSGEAVTDEAVQPLAGMKSLKWAHFQNCPITDRTLELLAGLPNLEYVQFNQTAVTGDGVKHLRGLPKLEILDWKVNDPDQLPSYGRPNLREIGKLTQIRDLRLKLPGLRSSDLKDIQGLVKLEELSLEMPLDDEGAMRLAGMTSLKGLSVRHGVMTDEGVKHLSNLRGLKHLYLQGHFTDRGLEPLVRLKSLWAIGLTSPYLTEAGFQALTKQLPAAQRAYWNTGKESREPIVMVEKDRIRRYGDAAARAAWDALEDKSPPPLKLTQAINAKEVTLAEHRGKVVLVDFTAHWCGPCRALTPTLLQLHEKYHAQGLEIIGIHSSSGAEKMADYVAEDKIPWPIAADDNHATTQTWHVESIPALFLIDRSGMLRMAGIYRDDAERAVVTLLEEKEPSASQTSNPPAPPAEKKASATTGTLVGRFVYDGTPPKPVRIKRIPRTDDGGLLNKYEIHDESLVVDPNGGLQNVFVWVRSQEISVPPAPEKPEPVTITFEEGRFSPHGLAFDVSRPIVFKNDEAKVTTNFNFQPHDSEAYNPLIPPNKEATVSSKPQTIPTKVYSSVFPWAQAWLLPLNHPYGTISGADGKFRLEGLPPGEWEIQLWHERKGYLETDAWPKGRFTVEIKPGDNDLGTVKLAPERFKK